MRWIFYNVLFAVGFAFLLPRFLWRMRRRGGYRRDFLERLGFYGAAKRAALAEGGRVWIHAVSVGEWFIARALMAEMRRRSPAARFLVSVNTSTAHRLAAEQLAPPDALMYFPLDAPGVARRVLRRARPAALLLVECELWPNLLRRAWRAGIPLALVNGRISERSYRGYYRLRLFTRRILPLFRIICAQSEGDRQRLLALGAPPERCFTAGSAKYEIGAPDPERTAHLRHALMAAGWMPERPILLGGSTWPGEEELLLRLWMELRAEYPGLFLILAPRHAERRPEIERLLRERGAAAQWRSAVAGASPAASADIFVLDTTGELRHLYPLADVIFVGKSLTAHGGQNPVEPAACGRPVVVGPHMENFPVVMADLRAADAVRQVADYAGLKRAVTGLLADAGARAELGRRAAELVAAKAGALRRTADALFAAGVAPDQPPAVGGDWSSAGAKGTATVSSP